MALATRRVKSACSVPLCAARGYSTRDWNGISPLIMWGWTVTLSYRNMWLRPSSTGRSGKMRAARKVAMHHSAHDDEQAP